MSNTIYLYLKTHNQTGLKYLGKTEKDPFKYKGSGIHWLRHIKKHGNDVTTEILFETNDIEEFKRVGIEYSEKLNIVESDEFANMIPESGEGVVHTPEMRKKISERMTNPSEETRKLRANALMGENNGMYGKVHTEKTKQAMSIAHSGENHHFYGKKFSEEHKQNISKSRIGIEPWNKGKKGLQQSPMKGKTRPKEKCCHCGALMDPANLARYHNDNCKHKK